MILIFERGNRPVVSAEDVYRNSDRKKKGKQRAAEARKIHNARAIRNFKRNNQGA